MRRIWIVVGGVLLILFGVWPYPAWSQTQVGLRVGSTRAPDQLHFGIHVSTDIIPHVRVRPNVEFGDGADLLVMALNPEVNVLVLTHGALRPYLGAGVGFNFMRPKGQLPGHEPNLRFRVGTNVLFGLEIPLQQEHSLLTEVKLGVGDIPDLKLAFGVTF